MTTLTAMDVSASVLALPTHESPRKEIRDALTVMCLRLHLSADETETVIDTALAARSLHQASPARAVAEGRKVAEQIAQRRRARCSAQPQDAA